MNHYKFRCDPVPKTGRRVRYYSTYCRNPKTISEMRQYFVAKEMVRGKRKPLHLPNSWDDLYRNLERSWKRQRQSKRQHGYDQAKLRFLKHFYEIEEVEETE